MSTVLIVILAGSSYELPTYSTNSTNFHYAYSISSDVSHQHRNPNLVIYAAETGAALLLGNAVGYGSVVLLSLGYETPSGTHQPPASILAYPVVYPLAAALGVHLVGNSFKCPGSYWGAVGGGFLGTAVSVGIMYITRFEVMHPNFLALSLVMLIPPVFSVAGYNIFGGDERRQSNIFLNRRYRTADSWSLIGKPNANSLRLSVKILEITF